MPTVQGNCRAGAATVSVSKNGVKSGLQVKLENQVSLLSYGAKVTADDEARITSALLTGKASTAAPEMQLRF